MIFVFGSNEAGVHGAGAARHAFDVEGAVWGAGVGHHGNSFAIPTKDLDIRTLPLEAIKRYVKFFIDYAMENRDLDFMVTRIGCGLAGYTDNDIAPLFAGAPDNCVLPEGWRDIIEGKKEPAPVRDQGGSPSNRPKGPRPR